MSIEWELEEYENVIFGDFEDNRKMYVKLSESTELLPRLDELLALYNADQSPMNLIFFEDCV
jgi:hypothetical protein